MRKLGFRFSCLAIAIVILAGLVRWCNISEARIDLYHEVKAYHEKASENAAYISFRLMKPYLDGEMRGRFLQRLDYLEKPEFGFLAVPRDSYRSLIMDMCCGEHLMRWAMKELRLEGKDAGNEVALAFIRERTPSLQVEAMEDALFDILRLSEKLNDDEDQPSSMSEIVEARKKFAALKAEMEKLLAEHGSVANGLP